MNFFTILRNIVAGRDLEQEAVVLANALEPRAWELVERRAGTLTRHEVRGYVRARVSLTLDRELRALRLSAKSASIVRAMALVELTGRFQARLSQQAATPMLRAA